VAWNPSAVDNDDEWITTERRLELMFGNDIVHHHFVTVDALPSLNDLLTRMYTLYIFLYVYQQLNLL